MTIEHYGGWTWIARRSTGTDYSGTEYELQAYTNSGADPWGPAITLTCES